MGGREGGDGEAGTGHWKGTGWAHRKYHHEEESDRNSIYSHISLRNITLGRSTLGFLLLP